MIKLTFTTEIQAPIEKVFDAMLGLSDKKTYELWTAEFNPTSTFEGTWEKGSKMYFIGVDENGEKGGMVSEIMENIPNQFISIRHYGLMKGGIETTEGPEVEQWANGKEDYSFQSINGLTSVQVSLDTAEAFSDYMNETYPLALQKLKEHCEN
jgi:uncharacterized protein YndB with AHSA1/START domain